MFGFRFVTLCYASLTETTCMLITARTFFASVNRVLPFKAWIPYQINSTTSYWITFFHQTVAHVGAANLQIANETLICGLMIQACSQLELLKYRFKQVTKYGNSIKNYDSVGKKCYNSPYSKDALVKCVEHHHCIMQWVFSLYFLCTYSSTCKYTLICDCKIKVISHCHF